MKTIKDQEFGGERPLYCEHDLRLENVTIHPGESSVKETYNIEAEDCRFEGKYVFWECRGLKVKNCNHPKIADLQGISQRANFAPKKSHVQSK